MSGNSESNGKYVLYLYISGATPRSRRAIANIKAICDEHLKGRYHLQVVDIFQNPEQTAEHDIVAAPTLVKQMPLPIRRFVGDLSDTNKVVSGLAISPAV
jgi:circadian clock protein KaiB